MRVVTLCALGILLTGMACAELQNVTVGAQIELRGRWYHNAFESGVAPAARPAPHLRIPGTDMFKRATGQAGNGVLGFFRYTDRGDDWAFVEQTTSLNVGADFTDNVSAFIEFYDYAVWGEDFRSNYVTGIDSRADTSSDVELLQSYIDINKIGGLDLRLRVGRQVMQFGKDLNAFLLAGKTSPTQRFSYDGVRVTYKPMDKLTLDAWWMKLRDRSPLEEDGDADFYGAWANYKFGDWLDFSAFWMWLRDAQGLKDTNGPWLRERFEDYLGYDDYNHEDFHTVGFEAGGKAAGFDYLVRVAYQFGEAAALGTMFRLPQWAWGGTVYGDDNARYDNWGMDATVGYTIPATGKLNVRPYLQALWYQGGDERDVSFADWLNPFYKPKASVSFNRLFSDINYCPVVNDNADMSNFWQVGGGVTMTPTEKLQVIVRGYNTWADEGFEWPAYIKVPRSFLWPSGRLLIAPDLSFWDRESETNMGFSADLILKYTYSANLTMLLYYGHLFADEGTANGQYISFFGSMLNGGVDRKDADYIFWWSILKF